MEYKTYTLKELKAKSPSALEVGDLVRWAFRDGSGEVYSTGVMVVNQIRTSGKVKDHKDSPIPATEERPVVVGKVAELLEGITLGGEPVYTLSDERMALRATDARKIQAKVSD